MLDEIFKLKKSSNMRMRAFGEQQAAKFQGSQSVKAQVESTLKLSTAKINVPKRKTDGQDCSCQIYQFSSKLVKDAPMKTVPNGDRII
ncbi:hypothetical protein T02_7547 [Trichinella nativa]|uniref:Uncharacterized protein n=1 Tax=Trichinella nativa TaxID=6335 RepID=A0A0V1KWB2_9BILA|nr:hypothetical protein T02_7547 [Trichinella nativa]